MFLLLLHQETGITPRKSVVTILGAARCGFGGKFKPRVAGMVVRRGEVVTVVVRVSVVTC